MKTHTPCVDDNNVNTNDVFVDVDNIARNELRDYDDKDMDVGNNNATVTAHAIPSINKDDTNGNNGNSLLHNGDVGDNEDNVDCDDQNWTRLMNDIDKVTKDNMRLLQVQLHVDDDEAAGTISATATSAATMGENGGSVGIVTTTPRTTETTTDIEATRGIMDLIPMTVWKDHILPMISTLLLPTGGEAYTNTILTFDTFFDNIPTELQRIVHEMITSSLHKSHNSGDWKKKFLIPWDIGHCFTSWEKFDYSSWDDGHPFGSHEIKNYSISSNFEYIALGDRRAGNIFVLGRNHNYQSRTRRSYNCVDINERYRLHRWFVEDDSCSYFYCFDRRGDSTALFACEEHPGKCVICIFNDLAIAFDSTANSNDLRPDHVIRLSTCTKFEDSGIVRMISIPASELGVSCIRFYFATRYRENNEHYVVDVHVNLTDGSYTEELVMEFVEDESIYDSSKADLSDDGKYFSIVGKKSRGEKQHSILVRDLNDGSKSDTWISIREMRGRRFEDGQVWISGNEAIISFNELRSVVFGIEDNSKYSIVHANDKKISGIACSSCLSPDGKVLALVWKGDTDITCYCTETWGVLCHCYMDDRIAEDITGLFFATSTGDTIGVVRKSTVFLHYCDTAEMTPDQSIYGDDAVGQSSEDDAESEEE